MAYTHSTISGAYRATGKVVKTLSTAEITKINEMGTELGSLSGASYANPTFKDATAATKTAQVTLAGATAGKKMTIALSHTDNRTVTFPDATDTLVGKATTDVLTNKTLTSPKISDGDAGVTVTSADQTNAGATVTIPNIGDAADEFVMKDTAQTLTGKTLTSPVLTNPATTFVLGTHDYGAAADDWTLSAAELLKPAHKPTNASGAVNAIVATTVRPYLFINATGYALTVKTAAGTGIAIANGKAAFVMSDGTNVIRVTADA